MRCRFLALAIGAAWLGLGATTATAASPCDEYDPTGPARTTTIVLNRGDVMGAGERDLRTFVATDSVGRVDILNVSGAAHSSTRAVSAVPEISRMSPYYGEQLRGISIVVTPWGDTPPARVAVTLRQVCARYFRNTFLYY